MKLTNDTKECFLIVGYPRSRTAWLANLLTHGRTACLHETAALCRKSNGIDPSAFRRKVVNYAESLCASAAGTAETALMFLPEMLAALTPRKVVVIHRPEEEIRRSLRALSLPVDLTLLRPWFHAAEAYPGAMNIDCTELDDPDCCEAVLNYVSPGSALSRERFRMLCGMNVQLRKDRVEELMA